MKTPIVSKSLAALLTLAVFCGAGASLSPVQAQTGLAIAQAHHLKGDVDPKLTSEIYSSVANSLVAVPSIRPSDAPANAAAHYAGDGFLNSELLNSDQQRLVDAALAKIAANPAKAPLYAGLYAALLKPGSVDSLADGIGKLARNNKAIAEATPEIARAFAIAIDSKTYISEDERARLIGQASSTIIYHMDAKDPANRQRVIALVTNVLGVNARTPFSDTVLEIILKTFNAMGFPDDYIRDLALAIHSAFSDAALLGAFDSAILKTDGQIGELPHSEITVQETPVVNQ